MGKPVDTLLHTKASKELQEEIEKDLQEPDPQLAKAKEILKNGDENEQ